MMKLQRLTTAAATAALALLLAGCGSDAAEPGASGTSEPEAGSSEPATEFEAGTTMAELAEAGELRVGTKYDQPGFGLLGLSDTPEGFDVEIAKIIATELGIDEDGLTFTEAPSMLRETLIQDGDVDIVAATYTINDTRKESVGFAGPYYSAGQDLMVLAENDTIMGPEDLMALDPSRVCSVTGSTPAETILEYIDGAPTLFDVYSKCADALRNGQVDVVTTDNVILLGLIAENGEDFKLVENPFTEEPYGIGYEKGDTAFCEFINESLMKASEDGRYEEAWTSTAGEFAPRVPELPTLADCA